MGSAGSDADLYLSFSDPWTYYTNSSYSSYNTGSDFGTISTCATGTNSVLYITVDPYLTPTSGALVQLSVTTVFTDTSLFYLPLTDMLYYDTPVQLLSSYFLYTTHNTLIQSK